MTKNIIIANWKMNQSFDDVEPWIGSFSEVIEGKKDLPEIVVCPPVILLDYFDEILLSKELDILEGKEKDIEDMPEDEIEKLTADLRKINIGAQDCGAHESGAFTGDVSAKMLSDAGCEYVILGHSERRLHHHEGLEVIYKKIQSALKNDLVPVFCIGESLETREKGDYLNFIKEQILGSLPSSQEIENLVIAYEPIWSIGTGKVPTVEQIDEVANFIKAEIENNKDFKVENFRILYGGSTSASNTAEIMAVENISGLLVGGASLKPDEFGEMCLLAK